MADLRETQKLGQVPTPGMSAARAASGAWLSTAPPASHAFTRASERPCSLTVPHPIWKGALLGVTGQLPTPWGQGRSAVCRASLPLLHERSSNDSIS